MQDCVKNGAPKLEQKFPFTLETVSGCEVKVDLLDWTLFSKDSESENIDYVLGADITYEATLIPPLCNVLRTLLSKK